MNLRRLLLFLVCAAAFFVFTSSAEAKSLYHATSKAIAGKIMKKGFSLSKMNPQARYGKGIYLSETKKLALKEKPHADSIVKIQDTKLLRERSLNINKLSREHIKKFSKDTDMRGNIKNGNPGGDLARKMGTEAGRKGKVIVYPSVRGEGMNTFVPRRMYEEHSGIVRIVKP